ncbi:MAG: hypothetical protein RMJ65_05860, partial [candidate division WOR-3 bacterium]|nr:hypothetical protein [candidate division WOR-3 bacterium]
IGPRLPILIGTTCTPSVVIRNNSIDPVNNWHDVKIYYQITGANTYYLDSIIEGIEVGNYELYEFTNFEPISPDTVVIKVWCVNSEDENPFNDTISKIVYIAPQFQPVPYFTSFNEEWGKYGDNPPFGGWRIIDCGSEYYKAWNTNDWHRDTIRAGNTLRTVAKVYYSPIENQVESLISPRINCSIPGIYTLSYWHWYRDWSPLTIDSGKVLISNNGGQTWQRITRYTNSSDSGYKIHDITQYASGCSDVRICFLYKARDEWYWCLDDFSVTFILHTPQLIYPPNNHETLATSIEFRWNTVPGATKYIFQIAYDSLFMYIYRSDTITTTSKIETLAPTRYFWRVLAGEPWSSWSEIRSLRIIEPVILRGWHEIKQIPLAPSYKSVKDGARITFSPIDTSIYVIKGNNTSDFYQYKISLDSWIRRSDVAVDTIKARKIKKGSALTYGDSCIYLVKGGTKEFWAFDIQHNTWIRKRDFPTQLKAGTDIVYVPGSRVLDSKFQNGYIYLLKGSDKNFEFWAYSISHDSWIRKKDAPRGPHGKQFKEGSSLVYDPANHRIYALKSQAKVNEFYYYDIAHDSWSTFDSSIVLPLKFSYGAKSTKVKNGALAIVDSIIYAIKGGGVTEFWKFNINQNRWSVLDSIPRKNQNKQSVPKVGACLTSGLGNIYLLKGNNTQEFWVYYPYNNYTDHIRNHIISQTTTTIQSESSTKLANIIFSITPNIVDDKVTVNYSLNGQATVVLTLSDVSGRVLKVLKNSLFEHSGNYCCDIILKDLPSGVYFVNLAISPGPVFHKKLVKK